MTEAGGNMHAREGWAAVTCSESDAIREHNGGVSSSLTDPEGHFGPAVTYTEWQAADGSPILRDYLWHDTRRPCEHLVPEPAQ